MGQNLVNGNKRTKGYFFSTTAVGDQRGYLFKNDDRPPELTFRDLLENTPFKSETSDQAQLDDYNPDLFFKAGLICLATDIQVKELTAKPTDRALAVQPSQMTTAISVGNQDINTAAGSLTGTPLVEVTEDATVLTRKEYKVGFTAAFIAWIVSTIDGIRTSIGSLNTQMTTVNAALVSLQSQIDALITTTSTSILDSTPVGTMIFWPALSGIPAKFVRCDNAAYNEVTYPDLFTLIGVTHGSAGPGTFRVPDTDGAFLAPQLTGDPNFGNIGDSGGIRTVVLVGSNLPAHTHEATGNGATIAASGGSHQHEVRTKGGTGGAGQITRASGSGTDGATNSDPQTVNLINANFSGVVGNGPGTSAPFSVMNPYKVPGIILIKALA